MITDERRAYKRVKLAFNLRYRSLSSGKVISGNSLTNNLSPGGIYFEAFSRITIGERLDCRIDLPGISKPLRFYSRVVRCELFASTVTPSYGIAAEFLKSFGNSDSELRRILADK